MTVRLDDSQSIVLPFQQDINQLSSWILCQGMNRA